MSAHRVSAIVLAGGHSRRFGDRDKALAHIGGDPMIRRVADRVAPVADELIVNCRDGQREAIADALADCALDPRFAIDPVPDRGPVYGLRTGLRFAAGENAVVVGCDLPFVEPALFDYLLDRVGERATTAAVPRAGGERQPLCGAYEVDAALDACRATVARGDSRLRTVLDCLTLVVASERTVREHATPRALTNVNTPADLDACLPDA